MDPGYNEKNRKKLQDNLKMLEFNAEFFQTNIFDVTVSAGGSPCYLCARMRRGHLYAKAKELGCNKIALGHHKSDVVETTLNEISIVPLVHDIPKSLECSQYSRDPM
jgi:tRNA(Ile)-lysidine synthase TilS/MesJ